MGDDSIQQLTMPKRGLAMKQGKVVDWLVAEAILSNGLFATDATIS